MAIKRKTIDWDSIEELYRKNQLSIRKIADQHGISEGAIRKKAKTKGWVRDLTQKINQRVNEQIASSERYTPEEEQDIIDRAANEATAVILRHRRSLQRLSELEDALVNDLNEKIENNEKISPREFASILNNIANCQTKRMTTERTAYNLDQKKYDESIDLSDSELDKEIESLQ